MSASPTKITMPLGSFRLLSDGLSKPAWPTTIPDIKRAVEMIELVEPLEKAGESDAENDQDCSLEFSAKQIDVARKCIKFWLSKGAYSPKGYALPLIEAFIDEGS